MVPNYGTQQGTSAAAPRKRNSDKPKKSYPPTDCGELTDTSHLVVSGKPFV